MLEFGLVARNSIRILSFKNPIRTGLGVSGGITTSTIIDAARGVIPDAINVSAFTDFRLAIAGAFVANLRIFSGKSRPPSDVEEAFETIKRAKKDGNLTDAQARVLYVGLCSRAIGNVHPSTLLQ